MELLRFVALLGFINLAPILAQRYIPRLLSAPVDSGWIAPDGAPLFGPSKTWRGIVCALAAGLLCAPVLDFSPAIGLTAALFSMLGDLVSSGIKRRMRVAPSGRALGLDQIPEALLPALAVSAPLAFDVGDIALIVGIFAVADLLVSRILYRWNIRRQPY